ncbi:MAG: Calcium-gated potassium channel MthK [Methanoregula sp. PtaU1.Bin051]|nr:MAG: Calcium-gated potassium channel MthK [Methanoregula sp. PtaU1.Bin051]
MREGVRFRLKVYLAILTVVVICGSIGLMITEDLHPFDAVYFVIVTVATVGFGDISPQTVQGKVITLAIILTGVGCFIALAADLIEYYISERERIERLRKMNMLVGVFFSECGTDLLRKFSAVDPNIATIRAALKVSNNWSAEDFSQAKSALAGHTIRLDSRNLDLPALHAFLSANKTLMVTMLENPHLIEHETFTELMQALFHLTEELRVRSRLTDLPDTDYVHLSGDINRVYGLLIREWLDYMRHLKENYPYLFSLAMRTNPFDANASPIVK